jgi:hypothetical protein
MKDKFMVVPDLRLSAQLGIVSKQSSSFMICVVVDMFSSPRRPSSKTKQNTIQKMAAQKSGEVQKLDKITLSPLVLSTRSSN